MKTFKQFNKSGRNVEISKYSLSDAIEYSQSQFREYGKDLYEEIPNFDKNFEIAQMKASTGRTLRKDMPVISRKDIADFKVFLKEKGVKFKLKKQEVSKFHPIQKQIYLNKSIDIIAKFSVQDSKNFLTDSKTVSVLSRDNYLIDGHHRMLTGLLINPKMKFNTIIVDLPAIELLPLALEFSDDHTSNTRNESYEKV